MSSEPTGESPDFDSAVAAALDRTDAWSAFPHELFRAIRGASPVTRSDTLGGWVVAGYPEAAAVLGDAAGYRVDYDQRPAPTSGNDLASAEFAFMADPPRHGQLRGVFARTRRLTRESVEQMAPVVRTASAEAVSTWQDGEVHDAVTEFAFPIVGATFAAFYGLSYEEMSWIASLWYQDRAIDGLALPRNEPLPAHAEVHAFVAGIVANRLDDPGDDFISQFVLANEQRGRMSRGTVVWTLVDLILNGFPSVQSAIALAVAALADHPEQFDELRGDPELVAGAVEEIFRWTAQAPVLTRRVARETVLGGANLRPGDRVYVFIPSANRDERIWRRPDDFDVRRRPEPPHLTFGAGIHQTPGAPLARMVLQHALDVLCTSVGRIARTGEPEFWPADAAEVQVEALPVMFATER